MDNISQNIQSFFQRKYHDLMDDNSFLTFEPLGCIIDPEAYKRSDGQFGPEMAIEAISEIADYVPEIADTFSSGLNKVSEQYEALVQTAQCTVPENSEIFSLFSEYQSRAKQSLDDISRMSLGILGDEYLPVTTFPKTWYDPDSAIWSSYSATLENSTSRIELAAATKPGKAEWNKLSPSKIALEIKKKTAPGNNKIRLENLRELETIAFKPLIMPVNQPTNDQPTPSNRILHIVRPTVLKKSLSDNIKLKPTLALKVKFTRLAGGANVVDKVTVESKKFDISFDYCLVRIQRPWLDKRIFDQRNCWQSVSLAEDFFSSGEKNRHNKGTLSAIPTGFLIIKNLNIKANWSKNDVEQASESIGLGCFNISDSEVSRDNLISAPLQIIGWICEVTPKMPVTSYNKLE